MNNVYKSSKEFVRFLTFFQAYMERELILINILCINNTLSGVGPLLRNYEILEINHDNREKFSYVNCFL